MMMILMITLTQKKDQQAIKNDFKYQVYSDIILNVNFEFHK